jgi:hypothetical protein
MVFCRTTARGFHWQLTRFTLLSRRFMLGSKPPRSRSQAITITPTPISGRNVVHRNRSFAWKPLWVFASLLVVCGLCLSGCSDPFGKNAELDNAAAPNENGNGVFGPPIKVQLLEPFQGQWDCDRAATFALWKSQGKNDSVKSTEEFEKHMDDEFAKSHEPAIRELRRDSPHGDITIKGNIIFGRGALAEEHDLFALHAHGSVVCGKAWFHEDRNDPGDMSKVWIRLELVGDELRIHIKDGESPEQEDADLLERPTLVDASKCETANDKVESQLWNSYVFRRPAQKSKADAK